MLQSALGMTIGSVLSDNTSAVNMIAEGGGGESETAMEWETLHAITWEDDSEIEWED